jgi:methionyl-tRNA formyltransferase
MRILLFGVSEFATELLLKLITSPYDVVGLVFNRTNNFDIQDLKALSQSRQIPYWEIDNLSDNDFIERVKQLAPDVILVATFDYRLPKAIYSLAKIAAINLHPSLLPSYRGYHPYFWPIANGEKQTGITFHLLDDYFDHGLIIAQAAVDIAPDDTAGLVIHKQKNLAWQLLAPVLAEMAATGRSPKGRSQPEGNYPKASKIRPEDLFIDWHWPGQKILDHIRALNPHSPAFTYFRDELAGVYQAVNWLDSAAGAPGEIVALTEHGPAVKTGAGTVLLKVLLAGKRYLLAGDDFVNREKILVGERFL